MALQRTKEAIDLLHKTSIEFGVDVKSLRQRYRKKQAIVAKRAFIVQARSMGIMAITIAEVLGLNWTTVCYHASSDMRARKKLQRNKGAPRP